MAKKPLSIYDEEINYDERIKIDLGKYFETLIRQWQWIVVCALGLGILTFASVKLLNHFDKSYTANVLVATTTTESSANFGSAITSSSDIQLAQAAGNIFYDRTTRLQSFVSQIQNGAIAEQVMQEVGPVLDQNGTPITASDLLGMVSGDLIPKTDTIQISFTYSDPVIAAEIANAWGKAYVQRINELYSSSGTTYAATQAEVTQAKTAYDNAEAKLEDFFAHDKTAEYTRQVAEISTIITDLQKARSSVGEKQVQDHLTQLDQAYSDNRWSGLFLENAIAMRAAVNTGGEPAAISNALALTMLKTQIYAAFQGTNTLQVQNLPEALGSNISTVNAAGMVADLDALISTLETRRAELDKLITTLSSDALNEDYLLKFSNANTPIENKILEDEQQIRDLNSLAAAQSSTMTELTETRDLAWKSYTALATKATEMSVNAQSTQVVFAASATPPERSSISATTSVALATVVGLLIGIIVAYAYEFWENYKGRQPELILRKMFAFAKKMVYKRPINSRNAS